MTLRVLGDPTLVDNETWYEDAERVHANAEALALTKPADLFAWMAHCWEAPRLVDWVITELGVPSPDLHPSGAAIPGSILRKILHHAHVEYLVRGQRERSTLSLAPAEV